MGTEILINASTHEARAALVESGVLQDYADALKATRSPAKREQILAHVVAGF